MPGALVGPRVTSTTLDQILSDVLAPGQRCRLLKIDCEGMEYEILSQSRMLHRIDCLAAEFHEGVPLLRDARGGPNVGDARALTEHCARFCPPGRMRIVFCPKRD